MSSVEKLFLVLCVPLDSCVARVLQVPGHDVSVSHRAAFGQGGIQGAGGEGVQPVRADAREPDAQHGGHCILLICLLIVVFARVAERDIQPTAVPMRLPVSLP